MQNDNASSRDPIVDHLMSSHAFKSVVWLFSAALMGVGLAVAGINMKFAQLGSSSDNRAYVLLYGGMPAILGIVPLVTMVVLPFSRRLK